MNKRILVITVLLLLGAGYGIFHYNELKDALSPCSEEAIARKIEKMDSFVADSSYGAKLDAHLAQMVRVGTLKETQKETFKNLVSEQTIRQREGCPVPKELTEKLAAITFPLDEDPGRQLCPEDIFKKQAEEAFLQIKSSMSEEEFNQTVEEQITQNIADPALATRVKTWLQNNPDMKKEIVTASIQTTFREKNNCRNVALPMNKLQPRLMEAITTD